MINALVNVIEEATKAFENYNHTRALELTESFLDIL